MARRKFWSFLLAIVPFAGMCLSVRLWDRVFPLVLGVPFNIAWLIAWIPLTSLCMWGAFCLQRGSESTSRSSAFQELPK
jgi:hypothetical protein